MPENGQVRNRGIFPGTVIMPRCRGALAGSSFPQLAAARHCITPYLRPQAYQRERYSARMIVPAFLPLIAFSMLPRL